MTTRQHPFIGLLTCTLKITENLLSFTYIYETSMLSWEIQPHDCICQSMPLGFRQSIQGQEKVSSVRTSSFLDSICWQFPAFPAGRWSALNSEMWALPPASWGLLVDFLFQSSQQDILPATCLAPPHATGRKCWKEDSGLLFTEFPDYYKKKKRKKKRINCSKWDKK